MWHRSAKEATERTGEADHNEMRVTGGLDRAGLDNNIYFNAFLALHVAGRGRLQGQKAQACTKAHI